jgi:D-alanyl-D-alanine carboxypeptidase
VYQRKFRPVIDQFAALPSSVLHLACPDRLALCLEAVRLLANSKYAGIVVDAKTGKTLYAHDADELRYPASLTKMMTLYMVFEALEQRQIKLNTRIKFSANAAKEPPTKLGVGAGKFDHGRTGDLCAGNQIGQRRFDGNRRASGRQRSQIRAMMTTKARSLGMSRTTFRNAHGLPNSKQVTTARDMARLGIALREHFPRHYKYFATRSFKFGKTRMGNHNGSWVRCAVSTASRPVTPARPASTWCHR